MSTIVPNLAKVSFIAERTVPAHTETLQLTASLDYKPEALAYVLCVQHSTPTSFASRVVQFDEGMFTYEEQVRLAKLLGQFIATQRGAKLVS
jgi:hypothetical protein